MPKVKTCKNCSRLITLLEECEKIRNNLESVNAFHTAIFDGKLANSEKYLAAAIEKIQRLKNATESRN